MCYIHYRYLHLNRVVTKNELLQMKILDTDKCVIVIEKKLLKISYVNVKNSLCYGGFGTVYPNELIYKLQY